jgi:hypothetical protein
MSIVQLFSCVIGRHYRNHRKVWEEGSELRSVCVGCGVPMKREAAGWVADRGGPKRRSSGTA